MYAISTHNSNVHFETIFVKHEILCGRWESNVKRKISKIVFPVFLYVLIEHFFLAFFLTYQDAAVHWEQININYLEHNYNKKKLKQKKFTSFTIER